MDKYFRAILILIFLTGSLLTLPANPVYAASLPAEINKQFSPLQIDAGGVSVMRVTIFNPNIFQLTNASWTDNLVGVQPGLFIANPAGVVSTCGGTVTAVPGTTNLSLSGGTVPAQVGSTPGECYIEVNISSTTAGNLINTIPSGNLSSQGDDGGTIVNITNTTPASATITVIAVTPPSLTKIFNPTTIFVGETSQLTIRLNNNDSDTNLTGATYTDNLPAGLVIATPNGLTVTNCGGGTVTAPAGGTAITLTNGTVTPAQDCLVQVNATGVAGTYTITDGTANTIPAGPGNPGSLQTDQGVTNNTAAQANLTIQPVGIAKAFAPATVDAGDTSTLTITLQNPTGSDYTGVSITDNLPAGLTVAGAPTTNTCGGTVTAAIGGTSIALAGGTIPASATPPTPLGTCIISIPVQTSLTSTGGTLTNTILANTLTATQPVTNFEPATANLTVNRALVGAKAFSPTSIVVGGISTVTITLTNRSSTDLTGVNFTDTLPTNLTISGTPTTPQCAGAITNTASSITLTGGTIPANGTCTITFNVTSNTASTYDNTVAANTITNDQGVGHASFSTNPDLNVINSATLPVGLTKTFQTDPIVPGQASRLRLTITAPADTSLSGINITDTLPAGLVVAAYPPATAPTDNCPGGTITAVAGSNTINFTNTATDVLAAGASCNIDVRVTSTTPGLYTNTIPANAITTIEGRSNINPATDTIRVTSLTMSKAFYPAYVQAGGSSTLTITLQNSTDSAIINVSLTDNLPGTAINGVRVAAVPNSFTTCGGTVTATPGTGTISLANGTIPAQVGGVPGLCTISVDVVGLDSTPATPSTQTNTIPVTNVTGTVQATGTSISPFQQAQATLNIQNLTMGAVKGFNPVLVYGGAYSTMSVQLINPNLNADLIGITFTDDMTLLGTGMRLANPVAFDVGTCGGTLTGNPGDTSFTFSGGILLANSSCTLTLHVVMNVNGNLTNRIPAGAVTTFNGISNPDPTEASLTNLPGVSVNKSFNPSLVLTGQPSILTITIANTSNVPVVNMGVADNLPGTLPDGVEIANPANASTTCGGTLTANPGAQAVQLVGGGLAAFGNPGDSCTITVSVLSTIPGVYINTIPAGGLTADGGVTNNNPASATLTVTSNYSLGNRVWYDTNNNNTIDFGTEVGIGGVRVELYQDNGTSPGVYDAGDTFLSFDDTDASGYYRFDNLSAGDYVVLLPADNFRNIGAGDNVPGDPLAGYWSSGTTITTSGTVSDATANDPDTDVDDSDENGLSTLTGSAITYVASSAVTLGPGASEPLNETDTSGGQGSPDAYANMTVDFGFYRQQLGNLIFSDLNNNGIFDTGDTPLASAVVQLYSSNGTEINVGPDGILGTSDDASGGVTTGAGGTYQFSGLPEGDYIVRVTPPTSSYTSTIDTADIADSASPNTNTDNNDNGIGIASGAVVSNAVTLTPSSVGAQNNNTVNNLTGTTTNPTVDFGFNASAVVTLGSTVFSDNNDNGLQDGSESGISGIRVELYLSSQTPGVDTPLAFDITDTNGDYFFDGLSAGSYIVYIPTPPASAPLSSNPGVTDTNDNSEDGDDNGSQVASGQPVVSPVITLTIGGETINEPNQGGTQDNANDANGDMTIDFGFVPTSALVADPALSKAGSPTQASVGDTIVFTITVTNTGNAPASGVVVTDPLPAMFDVTAVNASFNNPPAVPPTITVTPPIGTGPAPYTVVVALGSDLGVTDVVTITITTVVNSQGNPPITNVASLTTTSPSDVTANNVDAVTITVNGSGGNTGLPALLPATGFAPGVTTAIPQQPQDQAYAATDIVLEIPSIGVKATIVGVPKKNGAWDVSWLGKQVGWLEGSAFPSWSGNSVLTGHVYDSNGLPGPFVNLHKLKYGDKVIIHAYGQRYIFEVRTNQVVDPNDTSAFKHEDKSWLTLITCKEYDEKTNTYKKRVVVRAVLVKVEWDR